MSQAANATEIDSGALRAAVRDVLDREASGEWLRAVMDEPTGHDANLHALMAELGWTGLAIPERYGGNGAGLVELGIVLQELGHAPGREPGCHH